jgi:hypothetical protein
VALSCSRRSRFLDWKYLHSRLVHFVLTSCFVHPAAMNIIVRFCAVVGPGRREMESSCTISLTSSTLNLYRIQHQYRNFRKRYSSSLFSKFDPCIRIASVGAHVILQIWVGLVFSPLLQEHQRHYITQPYSVWMSSL